MKKDKGATIGYVVTDNFNELDLPLRLLCRLTFPALGILYWANNGDAAHIFESIEMAQEAIIQTEHYRLAFGLNGKLPEKEFCKIKKVRMPII